MRSARAWFAGFLLVVLAAALVAVPRALTIEQTGDTLTRHCAPLGAEKIFRINVRNLACERGYELVRTVMRHPRCVPRLACSLDTLEYECEGEVRDAGNRRLVCRRPELGKKFRFVYAPRAQPGMTTEEDLPGAED